jgi:hypothetical protein
MKWAIVLLISLMGMLCQAQIVEQTKPGGKWVEQPITATQHAKLVKLANPLLTHAILHNHGGYERARKEWNAACNEIKKEQKLPAAARCDVNTAKIFLYVEP